MSRGLRHRMSDDGVRISWSMWRHLRFPPPQHQQHHHHHHHHQHHRAAAAAMDESITEVLGCESSSYVAEPTSFSSCIAPDHSLHPPPPPFHSSSPIPASQVAAMASSSSSDVEHLSHHNASPPSTIPRKPFPPPLSPSTPLRSFKSNGRFVLTLAHPSPPTSPLSTLIRRDHLFLLRSFFQFLFTAVSPPPSSSPLPCFPIAHTPATAAHAPSCILVDNIFCHRPDLALKGNTIDLTSRLLSSDLRFNGAITITKFALVN